MLTRLLEFINLVDWSAIVCWLWAIIVVVQLSGINRNLRYLRSDQTRIGEKADRKKSARIIIGQGDRRKRP
jgi:hypothetical protein